MDNVTLGDPTVDLSDVITPENSVTAINDVHAALTTEKQLPNVPSLLNLSAAQIGVLGSATKILGIQPSSNAGHIGNVPAFIPEITHVYEAISTGKHLDSVPDIVDLAGDAIGVFNAIARLFK
jgi:hypothetical protein